MTRGPWAPTKGLGRARHGVKQRSGHEAGAACGLGFLFPLLKA